MQFTRRFSGVHNLVVLKLEYFDMMYCIPSTRIYWVEANESIGVCECDNMISHAKQNMNMNMAHDAKCGRGGGSVCVFVCV